MRTSFRWDCFTQPFPITFRVKFLEFELKEHTFLQYTTRRKRTDVTIVKVDLARTIIACYTSLSIPLKQKTCSKQGRFSNNFFSLGEIVCRQCYDKKYSCTAFSLSGAEMLKFLDTTCIKSEIGDKEACPRCAGKVDCFTI